MCKYTNKENLLNVHYLYYKTVNNKFGNLSYNFSTVDAPLSTLYIDFDNFKCSTIHIFHLLHFLKMHVYNEGKLSET